jgi:hypothetical protein
VKRAADGQQTSHAAWCSHAESTRRAPKNRTNSALACASSCTSRPLKWSVTPEVAGSSPVAPVLVNACKWDFLLSRQAYAASAQAANGQHLRRLTRKKSLQNGHFWSCDRVAGLPTMPWRYRSRQHDLRPRRAAGLPRRAAARDRRLRGCQGGRSRPAPSLPNRQSFGVPRTDAARGRVRTPRRNERAQLLELFRRIAGRLRLRDRP